MLYIVNEMTFSGYNVINLDLLYIIAILLGILVIISKNPEHIHWDQTIKFRGPLKAFWYQAIVEKLLVDELIIHVW